MAFAGAAAAEVTLDGSAVAGLRDTGPGGAFLHYEIDLDIIASGSTDNGLTFGASLDLDENNGSTDPEIFISGDFGTLTIGEVSPMLDRIGLRDIGFVGIGIDDDLEGLRFDGSEANITYVYSSAGFTAGISAFLDSSASSCCEGDYGIFLGYSVDGISAGVAYDYNESISTSQWGLNLGYSTDMYAVNLMYTDGDRGQGWGFDASYTMDALTVLAVYADDGGAADYGIGASYDLGGGLGLAGGIGERNNNTVWDLGLTMSF